MVKRTEKVLIDILMVTYTLESSRMESNKGSLYILISKLRLSAMENGKMASAFSG
jgi:hypothetical protein